MSDTPNLGIPYVSEGTADPAAGVNLALNDIDALLQASVISMVLTAPPGSPTDGDRYIVAATATGDWAGLEDYLVRYVADGDYWQAYIPGQQIILVLNLDDGVVYQYNESNSPLGWVSLLDSAGGVAEAPINGSYYLRKDGDWVLADPPGGRNVVTAVNVSSNTITLNASLGDLFTHTLSANITTLAFSNLPGSGKGCTLMLRIQQGAGPYTFAWPASFKWAGAAAPSISTANGAVDMLAMTTFDNGTTWLATLAKAFG